MFQILIFKLDYRADLAFDHTLIFEGFATSLADAWIGAQLYMIGRDGPHRITINRFSGRCHVSPLYSEIVSNALARMTRMALIRSFS